MTGEGLGYVAKLHGPAERLGELLEVTIKIGCEHLFNAPTLNCVFVSMEVLPNAS